MKSLLSILLLCPAFLFADPSPPQDMKLNDKVIQPIPIHPEMDTLLMFPEEVTLILGHGLTRGKHPGKVYCQQAENPKLIVLRQLEKDSNVLLQVVVGEQAYVFRLTGSDTPASVIRFHLGEQVAPAVELPKAEVGKTKRPVSEARMRELVRLTKEADLLKARLPKEYEGYQSRDGPMLFSKEGVVTTEIFKVARFRNEDVLVFLAKIRNDHPKKILSFKELTFRLQVGKKRSYQPSLLLTARRNQKLKPGEEIQVEGVLHGDGKGGALHLSVKNIFAFKVQH